MTHSTPFRIRSRMIGRDVTESGRVSSPLELLFDLTFVVAIAQIVAELAHYIEDDHAGDAIGPFLMVFFAIWWAWMNFTWFASGYDTDDVPYRLLTMVQMGGVLVLAAGVPAAFEEGDFGAITVGYFVMRLGLVLQWVRASIDDPSSRRSGRRYAIGISVVQIGWLLRLLLPEELAVVSFVVLAVLEILVPVWARLVGEPHWHPHHIAERYGLFTIILLGESVLAATTGVQTSLAANGVTGELLLTSAASLVIVFALWWLYYLEPAGEGLEERPERSYLWGYGHYAIFAALAAIGAGLEVVVVTTGGHVEASAQVVSFAVAIPVFIFLVLLWGVHATVVTRLEVRPQVILPGAVIVLLLPLATGVVGLYVSVAAIALVCALIVAITVIEKSRRATDVAAAEVDS